MRRIQTMMTDWSFIGPEGKKETVCLPHTWNALDGQDGGNDYYRGECLYEKHFEKPPFGSEEVVYLQFDGVNASARVVLNGKEIAKHENGYATFRVNITDVLKDNNELKVYVDNSVNDRVYPQMADFTFYGGIYREVSLLVVAKDHFDLDYYGGCGLKVTTQSEKTAGMVDVEAFTNVENEAYVVRILLADHLGTILAKQEMSAKKQQKVSFLVPNARLWNGVKDPYLYTVVGQIELEGHVIDEVKAKCGIRSFRFDPEFGFFLNGRPYPLHGVSRHQDHKGIGNAISKKHMEKDMELMKEVGATSIRLAHYQHDQYFYDLCDANGMVVWAEIPYISSHMKNGRENTLLQMKELIVQNYNHPSIVTWGLSNEITIKQRNRKDMLDNHRKLQALVKEMDPTRPTTLACFAMCHPFHPVTKISDLVGWNLYLGWYVPGLFLNDVFMKMYHLFFPKRPLCYSEYGAEGMPNLHSKNGGKRGDNSEEYQARYHEYMLRCFERHPFLWATYVWNMFDFAADARNQGGEPGMNHKGLVTFDRKIKKDSFYLYKAWWSEEEFVYLAGKRYEKRSGTETEIIVYSNTKEVTLYHNGEEVLTKYGDKVYRFTVPLVATNHIVVRSGSHADEMTIYQVDKEPKEYKLKKGDSTNWM